MSPLLETWRITMPLSRRAAMKSFVFAPACFKARGQISRRSFMSGLSAKTRFAPFKAAPSDKILSSSCRSARSRQVLVGDIKRPIDGKGVFVNLISNATKERSRHFSVAPESL